MKNLAMMEDRRRRNPDKTKKISRTEKRYKDGRVKNRKTDIKMRNLTKRESCLKGN